jgi:hypothetical protein
MATPCVRLVGSGLDDGLVEQALLGHRLVFLDHQQLAIAATNRVHGADQHLHGDVVLGADGHHGLVLGLGLELAGLVLQRLVVVAIVLGEVGAARLGERDAGARAVLRLACLRALLLLSGGHPEAVFENEDLELEGLLLLLLFFLLVGRRRRELRR